jgi:hypothetical protein
MVISKNFRALVLSVLCVGGIGSKNIIAMDLKELTGLSNTVTKNSVSMLQDDQTLTVHNHSSVMTTILRWGFTNIILPAAIAFVVKQADNLRAAAWTIYVSREDRAMEEVARCADLYQSAISLPEKQIMLSKLCNALEKMPSHITKSSNIKIFQSINSRLFENAVLSNSEADKKVYAFAHSKLCQATHEELSTKLKKQLESLSVIKNEQIMSTPNTLKKISKVAV